MKISINNKTIKPNGCGPKILSWLVPNLCFERACHVHDVLYADSRIPRKEADDEFLEYMLAEVELQKKHRKFYKLVAHIYYWSVRTLGWAFRRTK